MEITRLSSKGQVVIPKSIRKARQWSAGQEFLIEETEQGLLLKLKTPFVSTGCEPKCGFLDKL